MSTSTSTAATTPTAHDHGPGEDRLLDHAYDGIQEYDNPLPGWWKAIFIASIIFAIGYGIWFHGGGPGWSPAREYQAALTSYRQVRAAAEAVEARTVSETGIAKGAHDPTVLEHGRAVFAKNCVSCHTEDGHGLVGPNLTDDFQIHGTTRLDIYKTIKNGVPEMGMIAWGELMPQPDLAAVAAFVTTLRGTNVPGKPPQGERVGPFPE